MSKQLPFVIKLLDSNGKRITQYWVPVRLWQASTEEIERWCELVIEIHNAASNQAKIAVDYEVIFGTTDLPDDTPYNPQAEQPEIEAEIEAEIEFEAKGHFH